MSSRNKQDRELDAWIAEHVMGYKWKALKNHQFPGCWIESGGSYHYSFRPSTNPATAMEVLKQCGTVLIMPTEDGWCLSQLTGRRLLQNADTLELCICLFAKQLFATDGHHGST
jgi:hypothetical protein